MTNKTPNYTPPRPVQPSGKGPGWYLLMSLDQHPAVVVQKLNRRGDAPKDCAITGPYKTRNKALGVAAARQESVIKHATADLLGPLRAITNMCRRWWIVRIFHGKTFGRILEYADTALERYDR